ncbi:MAG: potassium channel family protein [Betaproteobacteria bacterium]
MFVVVTCCLALLMVTTFLHYEVLRVMTIVLPGLRIPARAKLIVVIFATFVAHTVEMLLYAMAFYALVEEAGVGILATKSAPTFTTYLYFSAETYTSLGYGDIVPGGVLRPLAGMEALNGLLLIGWSASYIYISMERFWGEEEKKPGRMK